MQQAKNIILLTELTRNSPGDEIAKVNFFYDIFNHFFAVRPAEGTEFGEITQNNWAITPFKVIQGHRFWHQSKASYTTSYYWLILTYRYTVFPNLHRFRDM